MSAHRCLNCNRTFSAYGIAGHRAMHKRKQELVRIRHAKGLTIITTTWDYRPEVEK